MISHFFQKNDGAFLMRLFFRPAASDDVQLLIPYR